MSKPLASVPTIVLSFPLAFTVARVDGQTGAGVIRGVVLDPQGSGVAGAKVTLTVPDGDRTREVQTSSDGELVFPNLQPGAYDIGAEAAGFKTAVQSGIRASVAFTTDVTIRLELGPVTESISVSAQTQPLQTADATVGNNFDGTRIQQLPLNARNIAGLLSLQPGVTRSGEAFGGRRDQANITLDGVDVNDQPTGLDAAARSLQGATRRSPPFYAARRNRFRSFVVTLNPNANQGRSSGAQVSLVTRKEIKMYSGCRTTRRWTWGSENPSKCHTPSSTAFNFAGKCLT
jgi:hypothetical protein